MGIRYYAYAFDEDQTAAALADPRAYLSDDPFADAFGMPRHARFAVATMEQSVPERDMLYLDKAWRPLQCLTEPSTSDAVVRAAYRMFEGEVAMHDMGWEPWIRVLAPADVSAIAPDVAALALDLGSNDAVAADPELTYALHYLQRAADFVAQLAAERRGMVYLIG